MNAFWKMQLPFIGIRTTLIIGLPAQKDDEKDDENADKNHSFAMK